MSLRLHAPLALVAVVVALAACAGARTSAARPCETADDHVNRVLGRTLGRYVAGSTGAAPGSPAAMVQQERAHARMDAWSEQHRRDLVAACAGWSEERYRCVQGAQSPQALAGCGLGDLVSSFMTDVLDAAAPLGPLDTPPPSPPR